ncbi:POTRA domain-containing protein [Flexistipes sp.]|uniref:POTRA domain-containing protein n=1 Tax=Flexistipes sp. TaxID=3088135 RepID=UPI002E24F0E9|nr:POTRA domain-containing protein [Flexistipes sp.]
MRALLFLTVFSFLFSTNIFSLEIQGNVDNGTKAQIKKFYSKNGRSKTGKLLNYLGYDFFTFNRNQLIISNPERIDNVVFHGNLIFLDNTLQGASGLAKGDPIYAETIENSAEKVRKYYVRNGYRNAEVSVSITDGDIVFHVREGKRFLVTDINVKNADYPESFNFLNPKIFDEELEDNYVKTIENYFRGKGYFNVSTDVSYAKNNKYTFFLNINNPVSSVMSVLPNFHQGVSLIVFVKKGKEFSLRIEGIEDNETEKLVRSEISRNLKGISSFYVRYTEGELEKLLTDKGYINPQAVIIVKEQEIIVDVNYGERFVNTKVNFIYNSLPVDKFSDEFGINRSLLYSKNEKIIKRLVTDKLYSKGYIYAKVEDIKFTKRNGQLSVDIIINEGDIYKVDDVFVNDKEILDNLQRTATAKEVNNLLGIVKSNINNKYYFTSISFDKFIMNKENNVDLVFKSDLSRFRLNKVISSDESLKAFIKEHFFDNPKITKVKIDSLKIFLASEKNYINYSVGVIPISENEADIVVSGIKGESNEIFGGFAYDDIEKFNVFAGYRRFDIFGTAHQFQIFTTYSSREKSLTFSLGSKNFFAPNLANIYSLGWKKRDEDTFEYEQLKASIQFFKTLNNFRYGLGLYAEELNFTGLVYDKNFTEKLSDNYRLIGIPLSAGNAGSYLGPVIEVEYSAELRLKPLFQIGQNSFITSELNTMLKIYPADRFRFKLKNDFGYISRNNTDIPLTYRYTLGGPYRMKAFDYRDIGTEDKEGNVYGGSRFYYFLFGAEYEIRNNVYLGPFVEYGNAIDQWDFSGGYTDVGIALTADTILGSIGISFAHETVGSSKSDSALYLTFSGSF